MQRFVEACEHFQGTGTGEPNIASQSLCVYLILSATLALSGRMLYQKCNASASDIESIPRVFPLLAQLDRTSSSGPSIYAARRAMFKRCPQLLPTGTVS